MIGQHKIIFTGPVGAGKTTAITAISDIAPISTEQAATDETRDKKALTTVAMDYGSMRLDNGEMLHLYGTPGQERFNFMWDLLIDGSIGVIIMLDDANPDPLEDLRAFVSSFRDFIHDHAVVVGITRMELGKGLKLADYHATLTKFELNIPVFEVDARQHDDVIMLVQALLYSLDPGLSGEAA
ncbi:putative ATP/GTP-binding protein [hydrothermal vent metagenome]|uniref:Putative ATP/GTP-binding protein n=1 Tax=hydrothermal vent metagenome TaxID=652676 RepID=A0A3B0YTA5_9ZZZZ